MSAAAMTSMHSIGPESSIRCLQLEVMDMVKVAAIQMCSGVDPERNMKSVERLVREAHAAGATYIQTPEMTGALQRDRKGLMAILRPESTDLIVAGASQLAKELRIHLHIGSTAILLDDGK